MNEKRATEAAARGYTFVDLRPQMSDERGLLRAEFSNDGIHLVGPGCAAWRDAIAERVAE